MDKVICWILDFVIAVVPVAIHAAFNGLVIKGFILKNRWDFKLKDLPYDGKVPDGYDFLRSKLSEERNSIEHEVYITSLFLYGAYGLKKNGIVGVISFVAVGLLVLYLSFDRYKRWDEKVYDEKNLHEITYEDLESRRDAFLSAIKGRSRLDDSTDYIVTQIISTFLALIYLFK